MFYVREILRISCSTNKIKFKIQSIYGPNPSDSFANVTQQKKGTWNDMLHVPLPYDTRRY